MMLKWIPVVMVMLPTVSLAQRVTLNCKDVTREMLSDWKGELLKTRTITYAMTDGSALVETVRGRRAGAVVGMSQDKSVVRIVVPIEDTIDGLSVTSEAIEVNFTAMQASGMYTVSTPIKVPASEAMKNETYGRLSMVSKCKKA
jgi:hypothetical protein